MNQAGKPAYATGGSPKAAPSRLEREEEGRLALYGTASGPASIDRPTAGSNTTLTAQPLGLAPANSALRCFPRADSTSALYSTSHDTFDDVLLADEVEHDDRNDREHEAGHHRTHVD